MRIRLVNVKVHPQFVVDDGETLRSIESLGLGLSVPPITVAADDWPTFATGPFAAAVQELQDHLDAREGEDVPLDPGEREQ